MIPSQSVLIRELVSLTSDSRAMLLDAASNALALLISDATEKGEIMTAEPRPITHHRRTHSSPPPVYRHDPINRVVRFFPVVEINYI